MYEYKLVSGDTAKELETKVTEYLQKGFTPTGGVAQLQQSYVQALVKIENGELPRNN